MLALLVIFAIAAALLAELGLHIVRSMVECHKYEREMNAPFKPTSGGAL
ncbi:hypothetical protein FE840_013465 [Peteryoungia desertarenae]|uniref:Uncharacterized protein n=1 Tax=Peteryoungia desertarenae TaxID=1813451 RepID=A0ABX6QQD6_9HYPH|nr:hypothetical protein [Peteryoungia desertarenae]QLF70462.1 hypothetical protein FE840_013465 [Peteryoungia desertarenae]